MQDNNIVQQIEQFHAYMSRIALAEKVSCIVSRQNDIKMWANALLNIRVYRGYFTSEERIAIRQLQDIQNELDRHKAELSQEVYNEITKELIKVILTPNS